MKQVKEELRFASSHTSQRGKRFIEIAMNEWMNEWLNEFGRTDGRIFFFFFFKSLISLTTYKLVKISPDGTITLHYN